MCKFVLRYYIQLKIKSYNNIVYYYDVHALFPKVAVCFKRQKYSFIEKGSFECSGILALIVRSATANLATCTHLVKQVRV